MTAKTSIRFKLEEIAKVCKPTLTLIELLPKLKSLLPPGVSFESNEWESISWDTRPGNSTSFVLYFSHIKNPGLRYCLKVFTLHKRLTASVAANTARLYIDAVKFLDKAILLKDVNHVRNADFYEAEKIIQHSHTRSTPGRHAGVLKDFGLWLNRQISIPISYEPTFRTVYRHGRKGPEEGRQEKLVSTPVIHEMIAANKRKDLLEKDRFFLSAFVILVATGFRITELATMPKDCLFQKNGITGLRFFPEKGGKLGTRYIASEMVPSVVSAIEHITRITQAGRTAVAKIRRSSALDWSAIFANTSATEYFVRQFAHAWTVDPQHRLSSPDGAWLNKEKRFVDVIQLIDTCGSQVAAAKELGIGRNTLLRLLAEQRAARAVAFSPHEFGRKKRISKDVDARLISINKLEAYCGVRISKPAISEIIHEAKRLQVEGKVFPCPPSIPAIDTKFKSKSSDLGPSPTAEAESCDSCLFDWTAILADRYAADYFVRLFAHKWTADPQHRMINADGAWLRKEKRFIDIIGLVDNCGSQVAAARQLGVSKNTVLRLLVEQRTARAKIFPEMLGTSRGARISWDTDSRIISLGKFRQHCGILVDSPTVSQIIHEAKDVQIAEKVYPCPPVNPELEQKYKRKVRPLITDKDGNSRLEPEDALFVIPKYALSKFATKHEDYRLICDDTFKHWFSGLPRSHGRGNHEDSCFSRLGILDPKTGEIAKYTSHDIRHWLDTTYAEGKMDECTIALVFGRKQSSNHTYDQTSKKQRLENLRQAVRDGNVLGHISGTYNRLATYSRAEAEQFLMAYTLMVNIMPHGACTLNWGLEPCPHHLGCFTKDGNKKGPCEHFFLEKNDPAEVDEVKRIAREVEVTLRIIPKQSPQYEHYQGIAENVAILLENCG